MSGFHFSCTTRVNDICIKLLIKRLITKEFDFIGQDENFGKEED